MIQKIQEITAEVNDYQIDSPEALETYRLKFLSRKGSISELFDVFKELPGIEKKDIGKPLNILKSTAEEKFNLHKEQFENSQDSLSGKIDTTLPVYQNEFGSFHPLRIVENELVDIFHSLGFDLAEGPEIEDDLHNFGALNFAEDHPARDMQDTFFIGENVLRTHTSSVQIREMERNEPPFRLIMPGRVYRNEAVSSRSNCFFHQIEGLYVDKNVTFADLKQTLYYFVQQFFGEGTKIRFRSSYFPFTEPSAEMDISCQICTGKGCNICKHTGWVEILGSGMVHPNVLKNFDIDPEKYTGFAFGMGVERIAQLKYQVNDLRLYSQNDLRFLQQFKSV